MSVATMEAPVSLEQQARAQLREAIDKRSAMVASLAEADRAATAARNRSSEISARLEAIEKKRRRPAAEQDNDTLVGALIAKKPLAAPALGEDEKELRAEHDALKKARDRMSKEVLPLRREAVAYAEAGVLDAAKCVLVGTGVITRLVDSLVPLEAEVVRRRLALIELIGLAHTPEAEEAALRLANWRLPCPGMALPEFNGHPEPGRWRAALEALVRDPDAPLPDAES